MALAVPALIAAACGSTTPSPAASTRPDAPSDAPGSAATPGSAAPSASTSSRASPSGGGSTSTPPPAGRVAATLLQVTLPTPLSRSVVVADGGSVLVIGGLTTRGTTGVILRLDPAAGTLAAVGHLASPMHDAAGARLGAGWLVVGGGKVVAATTVQRVSANGTRRTSAVIGALPAARADGAAVAAAGRVLVVGGGRGGVPDGAILATRDGVHFTRLGRLAVPVRYGAVVAVGGAVYVFGGATSSGDTDAIQRVDITTGAVRVVGHLPHAMSEASAFVLGVRVLIAGGMRAGSPTNAILAFDAATMHVTVAGRLPQALADAGVAVIGDTAYLVGGETGSKYLASVIAVR
jgi:hypothetical protein